MSGALRLAQGYSPAEVVLLEPYPFAPLIGPRKEIRDLANGGLTDRIAPSQRRRQIQQLGLNVRCKVVQTHDLTHTLPAQAAQSRKVRVVLGFAAPEHFFEMNRQGEYLRDSRHPPSFRGTNLLSLIGRARLRPQVELNLEWRVRIHSLAPPCCKAA